LANVFLAACSWPEPKTKAAHFGAASANSGI